MARETAEIPAAAERLLARPGVFAAIVERIEQINPRIVVFCGRGSSGHVGVYLRYLFEVRLGLLASAAAPSVVTAYQRPPELRDALFVVVSQSGRSPDLVNATQVARQLGALTLAIVNDENSPAAATSELVLPIGAGTEDAVAATKTVVLSMIAGAQLVAALARDDDLNDSLQHLPLRLSGALACDWSAWADRAAESPAAFVVGRGYGLGCVRETALKVAEILRVPALGYSAAELRHGPRASITPATPVLVLRQNDEAATAVDDLVRDLNDAFRLGLVRHRARELARVRPHDGEGAGARGERRRVACVPREAAHPVLGEAQRPSVDASRAVQVLDREARTL